MTATELLIRLTQRELDSLFKAARALPADKLDWKPAPGARSALDQLQEVATFYTTFKSSHDERRFEWSQEKFADWKAERAKITDLDELERITRESYAEVVEKVAALSPEDLSLPVEVPFPGEYTLADIYSYYYWNASYHEGQITYIATLLAE